MDVSKLFVKAVDNPAFSVKTLSCDVEKPSITVLVTPVDRKRHKISELNQARRGRIKKYGDFGIVFSSSPPMTDILELSRETLNSLLSGGPALPNEYSAQTEPLPLAQNNAAPDRSLSPTRPNTGDTRRPPKKTGCQKAAR